MTDVNVNQNQSPSGVVAKNAAKAGVFGAVLGGGVSAGASAARIKSINKVLKSDKFTLSNEEKEAFKEIANTTKCSWKKIAATEAGKCGILAAGVSLISSLIFKSMYNKRIKKAELEAKEYQDYQRLSQSQDNLITRA